MKNRTEILRPIVGREVAIVIALGALALLVLPGMTLAATQPCVIDRDLQMGVTGTDVKCLQQYLNNNGFTIAESGVGSKGKETGEYKALTEAAVIKWQKANNLNPAIGYFGARSRLVFKNGAGATSAAGQVLGASTSKAPLITETPVSDADAALLAQVMALKAKIEAAAGGSAVTTPQSTTAPTKPAVATTPAVAIATVAGSAEVQAKMKDVLGIISKAEKAIKKMTDAGDIKDAKVSLATAKDSVLSALREFIAGTYPDALSKLKSAKGDATDALDLAEGGSEEDQANEDVDNVSDAYDDAKDEIDQADDDGDTVTAARKLLKRAANTIDDAQTALDDEDFARAIDYADEADGLISDAIDAIGDK